MKNETENKNGGLYFKTFLIEIFSILISVLIFAAVMLVSESFFDYASIFATVAVAFGTFFATYYLSYKKGKKGLLNGLLVGGTTFLIFVIISFIVDDGAVTINTLFRLIIVLLASFIGGVLGVNKASNKKYI